MDWKVFAYILMLLELIPENNCSLHDANSTFTATGSNNGLKIYNNFNDVPDNISCLVCTDDETEDTIRIYGIKNTSEDLFETSFQSHGFFNISMTCLGNSDIFSKFEKIYVGTTITGLEVINTSLTEHILLQKPLTEDVTIEVFFDTGTEVNITVVLLNVSDVPITATDVANGSYNTLTFSKTLFEDSGMYTLQIEATNPLGTEKMFRIVAVQKAVTVGDVSIIPYPDTMSDSQYVMTNLSFDISPVALFGEMLVFTAVIRDETSLVDVITSNSNYTNLTICDINYALETTGVYYIDAQISNCVSSHEITTTVNSIHEVNAFLATVGAHLILSNEQIVFDFSVLKKAKYPMGIVTCEVLLGDGIKETVSVNITETLPDKIESLSHEYIAGWYTSSINCTNQLPFLIGTEVTTGETFTFELIVENPVKNLELVHNSPNATYHPSSKPITINIKLSDPKKYLPLENLTCTFTYGDVSNEVSGAVNQTSTISHVVDIGKSGIEEGKFLLTVNCSNRLQHQILTHSFFIYQDCWNRSFFDSIFKDPIHAQTTYTHIAKTVQATLLPTGRCQIPHASSWTVNAQGKVTHYRYDSLVWKKTFAADTMDEGQYKIEFTVNMTRNGASFSVSDFLYLNYTLPDLLPAIHVNNVDNPIRKLYIGNIVDIILNTEPTTDPAEGLSSVASIPLQKTMACSTSAFWNDDSMLSIIAGESAIGHADSCDGLIQTVEDKFLVAVGDVRESQWYIFTLTVIRSHRTSSLHQAIQPTSRLFPDVSFQSISNGYKTSSNFYKLFMGDLQLNVISGLDNDLNGKQVSYAWKMEIYDNSSLNYITADVSGTDPVSVTEASSEQYGPCAPGSLLVAKTLHCSGFKVPKEKFQSWNGIYYRLFCAVSITGYDNVTIYRLFVMKQVPYDGKCSLDVGGTPAIPSRTNVCFSCYNWKDERRNNVRDPVTDHGGSLIYFLVQIFLTPDGKANESIPEYRHIALPNVDRCFKLVRPPNRQSNYTRVEIRIQDEFLAPYAAVTFDDIEIENLTIETAADVHALYNSFENELDEALRMEDLERVISIATAIAAEIDIDVTEEPLIVSVIDTESELGNMADISLNGSAVSFEDIMEDLTLQDPDPLVQQIQQTNKKIAEAVHNATITQFPSLTLPETQEVAQCVLKLTSTHARNFDKAALDTLENVTQTLFIIINSLEDDGALADEIRLTSVRTTISIADKIVPDSLKYMEPDVSLAAQRKRDKDAEMFASPQYRKLKETNALMTEDERDFYLMREFLKVKSEVDGRLDLTKKHASSAKEFQISLLRNAKVSNGAETVIGDNSSFAKMTKDSLINLANKTISAPTTSVNFPELHVHGLSAISIGIYEVATVTNIDKNGQAARITSGEKRLVLESEGKIPETIRCTHKISEIEIETVVPLIDPEDASAFDYRIVLVNRADDDLNVFIQPTSERVDGYDIYIFYTDDEKEHVSKIQYKATAESRYPDYIARFPPSVRGSQTGVWQLGIETIFKDDFNSGSSPRSRRSASPVTISDRGGNTTSANDTETKYPPYRLATATMGCMTWDDNAETWKSDECKSTWKPEKGELECECKASREMTFANSFYVQPNAIDFSSVFLKFSPLNQAAVMATLALVFMIYIFVILWARRQDKKDLLKWGITPLSDNFSVDNYFYIIKVYTGMRPGAGTRSRVSMIIAGEELDTGVRELGDGVRHEFPTGSVMTFLLSTPLYLGDLEYMRIWHDNSGGGKHASWYPSKIELCDIQRGDTFTFLIEQWLAVEEGVLECVVPVCKDENLNIFKTRVVSNLKDNIAESHMWISIVYRPHSSTFTRVQRASCALVFIMLTMISNAMFFKGSNEENYETPAEVQAGPFKVSLQQIYVSFISALIVTPVTLLLICLFKMSNVKPKKKKEVLYQPAGRSCCCKVPILDSCLDAERKRSMELERHLILKGYPELTGFTLPENCINLAWVIVVVATILPGFFIMLYSMEWGKQKSEEWVTTFLLSFFQSVFCLDPAKIIFMAIAFALIFRTLAAPTAVVSRNAIIKNYTSKIRGISGGTRVSAPPLDKKTLNKARSKRQLEQKMKSAFLQTILCLLLIWIMISISYSSRDTRSFDIYKRVVDTFLQPIDRSTPAFSSIKTTTDFFNWLNKTFIVKAFPETEPGDNNTQLHWRDRKFIKGGELLRVGPPRLRQLRTKESQCSNKHFGSEPCFKKYLTLNEDSKSYCIGWKTAPCKPTEKLKSFSSDAWSFTSALDIWGVPVAGYYTTYGGGGYIAKLSVNRQISQLILDELYMNSWVDRQTRAVLIEFTLYCLNANIFAYNMFMVEFLETGGAFTFYSIAPLRVYHHLGAFGLYTLMCEILFVLLLIAQTVIIVVNIVKDKREFLKNNWNVYDLVYVFCGYLAIAMYITQNVFVDETLNVFRSDKGEFVNFYHITIWNLVLVTVIGILVFMAIIRMIGILGYSKRIGIIVKVFSKAANELFWFGLFFLFFFTTYASFGYLLFGWKLGSYMNIFKSMETLFVSMLGKSRFAEIEDTDPILSKFYFMIFVFFLVYMILTMFLGILTQAIDDAAAETRESKGEEMIDYFIGKFQSLVRSSRSNRNTVLPSQGNQKAEKYMHRWKVMDVSPQEVLTEIRDSIAETLIAADSRDFTTPGGSKGFKFRRQ